MTSKLYRAISRILGCCAVLIWASASTESLCAAASTADENAGKNVTLPSRPLPVLSAPFAKVNNEKSEVKTFQVQMSGTQMAAGSKTLSMNQDGVVQYSADGRQIGRLALPFLIVDKKKEKPLWLSTEANWPKDYYDLSASSMTTQGNALICKKVIQYEGKKVELLTTLQLLENGKIQLSYKWSDFGLPGVELVPKTLMLNVSPSQALGTQVSVDGVEESIAEKASGVVLQKRDYKEIVLFARTSETSLTLLNAGQSGEFMVDCRKDTVMFRVAVKAGQNEISLLLDISKGIESNVSSQSYAGIDFKAVENLEMPDYKSSRNLIQNPSFEQGLDCYWGNNTSDKYGADVWGKRPYVTDTTVAKFGRCSLKMMTAVKGEKDFRFIGYPIKTFPVPLSAGKYTFSFYARGEVGETQRLSVFVPNVSWLGTRKKSMPLGWKSWQEAGAQKVFTLTPEWSRYVLTFEVPDSMPVVVSTGADSLSGKSSVWLDGLQLEAGEKAGDFVARPVEARLLTSRADNFLSTTDVVNARLEISGAPEATGTAEVSVKNFFGEELYRGQFPFVCDKAGVATVALPLEGKLTRGIFVVKAQYTMKDGSVTHGFYRLSVMNFLENKHRLKALFSENYGDEDIHRFDFQEVLDRYRKIGLGGKNHTYLWDRIAWDEYARFGIESTDSTMYSLIAPYTGIHSELKGFCIAKEQGIVGMRENDSRILIRDYNFDAGGQVTDEYLEKFKAVVARIAQEHPWIPMWAFGIEIYSKFPVDWWSKDGSADHAYQNYAKILKAFYQGVKQGNPKALVYQDAPSNMSPERGIPETGRLLAEVNKLGGVKFDMIGIHTYRKSPENPDLDEDAQTLFKTLEKEGYKDTPVFWPEGMHYGPYTISRWGIESASWLPPQCWYYGTLSYDMGWSEKISAAWRARSWLIALKHQDRVKSLMSSAYINNLFMDLNNTPFATQKISNTLGRLLGDATFKKDVRFAPYMRCYIFEDAEKRPVAAVWTHHPKIDAGTMEAPKVSTSFEGKLESIFDLMECERTFSPGKDGVISFQVSSFPLFFRGRPGSLEAFIKAFEGAMVISSGEGIAPVLLSSKPLTPDKAVISVRNYLSRPLEGLIENGTVSTALSVSASGTSDIPFKLPTVLTAEKIVEEQLPLKVKLGESTTRADVGFRGFLCRKVTEAMRIDGDVSDWATIPAVSFTSRSIRDKKLSAIEDSDFSGWFKVAWNEQGIYCCVKIVDDKFVVNPFPRLSDRWNNDSLQIYFDSFCDARAHQQHGYDENDYDYAVFPVADGRSAEVYRSRTPDPQLGLATQAPQNNTLASDIPCAFKRTEDGYVYEVFFPAKYLLPIRLEKGAAIGFGLVANDRDESAGNVRSTLTVTPNGEDCYNQPHLWPALLLWDGQ
jgi:hypothetical protein